VETATYTNGIAKNNNITTTVTVTATTITPTLSDKMETIPKPDLQQQQQTQSVNLSATTLSPVTSEGQISIVLNDQMSFALDDLSFIVDRYSSPTRRPKELFPLGLVLSALPTAEEDLEKGIELPSGETIPWIQVFFTFVHPFYPILNYDWVLKNYSLLPLSLLHIICFKYWYGSSIIISEIYINQSRSSFKMCRIDFT